MGITIVRMRTVCSQKMVPHQPAMLLVGGWPLRAGTQWQEGRPLGACPKVVKEPWPSLLFLVASWLPGHRALLQCTSPHDSLWLHKAKAEEPSGHPGSLWHPEPNQLWSQAFAITAESSPTGVKVVFLNVDYEDFHIYLTLDVFHLIVSQTVSYRYQILWPPAEDWVLPWESSAHNTGSVWLISLMFSWSCFILSESLYTLCWLSPSSCHSQPQLSPHILGKRAPQWLEELRMGGDCLPGGPCVLTLLSVMECPCWVGREGLWREKQLTVLPLS